MAKPKQTGIVATPTPWQDVILVCRKCSKKLGGGFGSGDDETLARVLKRTLREAGRRRTARVIEVKCLGLCPKGAVTVLPASDPGALLSVPAGADLTALAARLLPPRPSPPRLPPP